MFTRKPQPNALPAHLCHIRHLDKLGPLMHISVTACRFVLSTFTDHLSRYGSQRKVSLPVFLRSSVFRYMTRSLNWIHYKSLSSRFIAWRFWKVCSSWKFLWLFNWPIFKHLPLAIALIVINSTQLHSFFIAVYKFYNIILGGNSWGWDFCF